MSKTIDEKVVQMRFDNKQFESNVQTSLSTIDKLKQSLNLTGAAKGLEDVSSAAKNVNFSSLSEAVETVHSKFSALDVMAVTVLSNITNSAVNAGKKLVSSLSVDQITAGWSKYADKTSAVQTIMAATAKDFSDTEEQMEYVNSQLEKLNWFTDETSYNFLDMVSNIGKFTSNSVKLDTAVTAMQGISTWAAISGANTQEAGRAMYNLSQAIAVGSVKLIDWKSIENANMATSEFKQTAIDTAVSLGTLIDKGNGLYETLEENEVSVANFNENLSDEWFTSEVLLSALNKYGGFSDKLHDVSEKTNMTATELLEAISEYKEGTLDIAEISKETGVGVSELSAMFNELSDDTMALGQRSFRAAQEAKTFQEALDSVKDAVSTGWMNTFELIFGDYEQAKKLWTTVANELYDIFASSAEARNDLLGEWNELGGRETMLEAVSNAFESFKSVLDTVKSAFRDVFPAMTAKQLVKITENVRDLTEKFKMNDSTSKNLKNTFKGLFSVLNIVKQAVSALLKNISPLLGGFGSLSGTILSITGAFGEWLVRLGEVIDKNDIFDKSVQKVVRSIQNIVNSIKKFISNLKEEFNSSNTIAKNLQRTLNGLFAVIDIGKQAFSALSKSIGSLFTKTGGLNDKLSDIHNKVLSMLPKSIVHLSDKVLGITGNFGDWLVALDETIIKNDTFNNSIQKVTDFVNKAVNAVKNFADSLRRKLNLPDFDTVKQSFSDFIHSVGEKADTTGLEIIHDILDRIGKRISQIGKVTDRVAETSQKAIDKVGKSLSQSNFVKVLESLWKVITTIARGIAKVLGTLAGSIAEQLGDADFDGILDLMNSLALGLIAFAVNGGIRGTIEKVTEGIGSFGDIIKGIGNTLDGAVKTLGSVRDTLTTYQTQLKAETLLRIAAAIGILTISVLTLSLIDSDKLNLSLGAITVMFADLMGSMAIFSRVSGNMKNVTKVSAAMIAMSVSVLILASALRNIGTLQTEELVKGMAGITGMATVLVASAMILSKNEKSIIKGAGNMILFSVALKIMASALNRFGSMSWEEIGRGFLALTLSLFSVTVALKNMPKNTDIINIGVGLTAVSAALLIMSKALRRMGAMSWEEIAKGFSALTLSLFSISIALKNMPKNTAGIGIGLVVVSTALLILAQALKKMGSMDLENIGKGLLTLTVSLFSISIALKNMPKNMAGIGLGLIGVSTALLIIVRVLKQMGSMSLEEIGKSLLALAGSMAILAISLNFMKGTLSGSAALLVAAAALAVLTPVLKSLGSMSWEEIAKGLIAIAGAFTVVGVAGFVLGSVIPSILALGASFALLGIGIIGIGAGLLAAGLGLQIISVGVLALGTSLSTAATAIVAALTVIIIGIADMIPTVAVKVGEGFIEICKVITDGMPELGETVKAIILTLVDVLAECVPPIVDCVLELLVKVLDALVEYTPQIVDDILIFLIEVLEGIAKNLPPLIKAAIDVIIAFFAGIADALSNIDTDTLLKGIVGIGLLSVIMYALSSVASVIPGATIGVLGMGAVIAELALVLAGIGLLQQIPGLNWLINEGGKLLEGIGTAIGSFFGGIVGGFMGGVSSQFPKIGSDLSEFMENVQPFIEGANKIDESAMSGVQALADVILTLTAADILNGLTSWFTGKKTSIADFGEELAEFGPYFNDYYESIKGIDGEVVQSSANAAKVLAEMADNLPKQGGVVGWFEGENSLADFAKELSDFGPSLKKYSNSVKGVKASVVTESANAAKALAEMANNLPERGGVVGWFKGEKSLSDFAKELSDFGPSLKLYSESVKGLNPKIVINSTHAAKALFEMANNLPERGGVVGWFKGEKSLSDFSKELADFGPSLKLYSESVKGLDTDIVVNSANAAKSLAELANNLPNQGGVVGWFEGNQSLSVFGEELSAFGPSIKEYADSVEGLDTDIVVNSANAAKSLAELSNNLPNQGGLKGLFSGEKNLGTFGDGLVVFGEKFAEYSDYMKNVDSDIVTTTTNAANSIVELQNKIPEDGGLFSKTKSLADFGNDMSTFGSHFSGYYNHISGIDTTKLSNIIKETNNLVSMANGMADVDTRGMEKFGSSLNSLGKTIIDDFINAFKNVKSDIEETATEMVNTFINSANKKKIDLQGAFSDLAQAAVTEIDLKKTAFSESGKKLTASLITGIVSKTESTTSAFIQLLKSVASNVDKQGLIFTSSAQMLMNQFINSINDKKVSVQNAVSSVVDSAVSSIRNKYNELYNVGLYLVDGFVSGINSNITKVNEAATTMANAAAKASRVTLDEHSPSKVGYEIGDFFGLGFVNAIKAYEDKSYEAGKDISYSAQKGLSSAISKIADIADSDMDIQPTIRPVVDLSEVTKSADSINSLFNAQRSVELAGKTSIGVNTASGNIQNGINVNNDEIIKEMNNLRGDIASLANVIGRMKVIMDTGALVGALATPMNTALGRQSVYEKRGN